MNEPVPSLLDYLREDPEPEPGTVALEDQRGRELARATSVTPATETFACTRCGSFAFGAPTECYWCRSGR